jgi:hypothetical protein
VGHVALNHEYWLIVFEQNLESCLLEVMIGGQRLANACLLHHDEGCTVYQPPFFVQARAE